MIVPEMAESRYPKGDSVFDAAACGYGAIVEQDAAGQKWVNHGGMSSDEYVRLGLAITEKGWGVLPIGRVDPQRPDDPPNKIAWVRGYHGRGARTATDAEIVSAPRNVIRRILGGERGILNMGARVPDPVLGLDCDEYGNKHGLATLAEHEARLGPLPLTYVVTARPFESGSGIRLYRVPVDWEGPGVLAGGHVDLIQRHLRYIAAPGSIHHTGARYALYHQDDGKQLDDRLMYPDALPALPDSWLAGLYRRPRMRGAYATTADVRQFAEECTFDDQPQALGKTVQSVREAIEPAATRPATHRALYIAARKARGGCYPWTRARDEIERAAREVYAARGEPDKFSEYDFARSVEHAVTEALDLTTDELARWGPPPSMDLSGWQLHKEQTR